MPKKSPRQNLSRDSRLQLFVVREADGWTIKGASKKSNRAYPTQKEAQQAARAMIQAKRGGEIVIQSRDGRIKEVDTYVVGEVAAKTISAVEGIYLSQAMARDFRELDRLKLSADDRRQWLMSKYAKPYSKRRGI